MTYIKSVVIGLLVFHFAICTIGTFIMWELMYFNINTWSAGARFFYSFFQLVVIAISLAAADQSIGERNEQA